jgi:hypothetical protein
VQKRERGWFLPEGGSGPREGSFMARFVVIEEFHLTVLLPSGLAPTEADAVRQTLTDPTFEARLLRLIRRLFRRESSLNRVRVRLSR